MFRQPCGQCGLNLNGRHRRLAALALAAMVTASCDGSPRDPTGFLGPGNSGGQTGTGGGGGPLAGTWRIVVVIEAPPDIQVWTTTWRLRTDTSCGFTREILSLADGTTRTTSRNCTWTTLGGELRITWTDTQDVELLPFSFPSLSPDILIIQGATYRRITE